MRKPQVLRRHLVALLAAPLMLYGAARCALGLIVVSHGNRPVRNLGWPAGCETVANLPSRLGYWEGPPFGGGEYHFSYRCKDTAEFNEALKAFAAIQTPELELVVRDGPGPVYGFGPRGAAKTPRPRVAWTFTVWCPRSWHRLHNSPRHDLGSDLPDLARPVPPPRIDVYVGEGSVVWQRVQAPKGIRVIDRRGRAAPGRPVAGGVVHGEVYDMATGQPVGGARVVLAAAKGRGGWEEVARATADAQGSFVIRNIPAGRYQVWIRAEGYAARKQGWYHNHGQTPRHVVAELAREGCVKGIATDAAGNPIAGAKVFARETRGIDGVGYACADLKPATTDKEGRFEIPGLPTGYARIRCHAPGGYHVPRPSPLFKVPSDDVALLVLRTGTVRGIAIADEEKLRAGRVLVYLETVGRARVDWWAASARCRPDGSFEFRGVPPGQYVLRTTPRHAREGEGARAIPITIGDGDTIENVVVH